MGAYKRTRDANAKAKAANAAANPVAGVAVQVDTSMEILALLRRSKLLLSMDSTEEAKDNTMRANTLYESAPETAWPDEIEIAICQEFHSVELAFTAYHQNKPDSVVATATINAPVQEVHKSKAGRIWLAVIGTFFLSLFLSWFGLVIGIIWIWAACACK